MNEDAASTEISEECSQKKSSILKPPKPRIPFQNLGSNEDDTAEVRRRRVSFAGVNKIKEFDKKAESVLICDIPAYEEEFSSESESSQSVNSTKGSSHTHMSLTGIGMSPSPGVLVISSPVSTLDDYSENIPPIDMSHTAPLVYPNVGGGFEKGGNVYNCENMDLNSSGMDFTGTVPMKGFSPETIDDCSRMSDGRQPLSTMKESNHTMCLNASMEMTMIEDILLNREESDSPNNVRFAKRSRLSNKEMNESLLRHSALEGILSESLMELTLQSSPAHKKTRLSAEPEDEENSDQNFTEIIFRSEKDHVPNKDFVPSIVQEFDKSLTCPELSGIKNDGSNYHCSSLDITGVVEMQNHHESYNVKTDRINNSENDCQIDRSSSSDRSNISMDTTLPQVNIESAPPVNSNSLLTDNTDYKSSISVTCVDVCPPVGPMDSSVLEMTLPVCGEQISPRIAESVPGSVSSGKTVLGVHPESPVKGISSEITLPTIDDFHPVLGRTIDDPELEKCQFSPYLISNFKGPVASERNFNLLSESIPVIASNVTATDGISVLNNCDSQIQIDNNSTAPSPQKDIELNVTCDLTLPTLGLVVDNSPLPVEKSSTSDLLQSQSIVEDNSICQRQLPVPEVNSMVITSIDQPESMSISMVDQGEFQNKRPVSVADNTVSSKQEVNDQVTGCEHLLPAVINQSQDVHEDSVMEETLVVDKEDGNLALETGRKSMLDIHGHSEEIQALKNGRMSMTGNPEYMEETRNDRSVRKSMVRESECTEENKGLQIDNANVGESTGRRSIFISDSTEIAYESNVEIVPVGRKSLSTLKSCEDLKDNKGVQTARKSIFVEENEMRSVEASNKSLSKQSENTGEMKNCVLTSGRRSMAYCDGVSFGRKSMMGNDMDVAEDVDISMIKEENEVRSVEVPIMPLSKPTENIGEINNEAVASGRRSMAKNGSSKMVEISGVRERKSMMVNDVEAIEDVDVSMMGNCGVGKEMRSDEEPITNIVEEELEMEVANISVVDVSVRCTEKEDASDSVVEESQETFKEKVSNFAVEIESVECDKTVEMSLPHAVDIKIESESFEATAEHIQRIDESNVLSNDSSAKSDEETNNMSPISPDGVATITNDRGPFKEQETRIAASAQEVKFAEPADAIGVISPIDAGMERVSRNFVEPRISTEKSFLMLGIARPSFLSTASMKKSVEYHIMDIMENFHFDYIEWTDWVRRFFKKSLELVVKVPFKYIDSNTPVEDAFFQMNPKTMDPILALLVPKLLNKFTQEWLAKNLKILRDINNVSAAIEEEVTKATCFYQSINYFFRKWPAYINANDEIHFTLTKFEYKNSKVIPLSFEVFMKVNNYKRVSPDDIRIEQNIGKVSAQQVKRIYSNTLNGETKFFDFYHALLKLCKNID